MERRIGMMMAIMTQIVEVLLTAVKNDAVRGTIPGTALPVLHAQTRRHCASTVISMT
jgi:hypothetical protein